MRHQPHLHLPRPWRDATIGAGAATEAHLTKVLRYRVGSPVSYTDGLGRIGSGTWTGTGVERGDETEVQRPGRFVSMLVAPPKARDRQRFVVEKLQELGVAELRWWATERTQGKPPRQDRAASWAVSALEQSRGAYLMDIGPATSDEVAGALVADADGTPPADIVWLPNVTIAIGPEGGLTPGERDAARASLSLGPTVLRSETAAIAAAVIALR